MTISHDNLPLPAERLSSNDENNQTPNSIYQYRRRIKSASADWARLSMSDKLTYRTVWE